jgi:2-amino-4-hydroxy-6-hydroxymethyldihydropteridine diphosphokinase
MTGKSGRTVARRVRAYVGLGANVGDAAATLARGVAALAGLPGVRLRGVSRLYATTPWGVTDQPDFRNAVVALDVPAGATPESGALALLAQLKELERAAGRRRRRRWGPRELDLDLLVFGRHRILVERPLEARSLDADADPAVAARLLQVPHRDLGERLFVLAPLADLAPGLVPPGWHETVETARRRQESVEGPGAVRVVGPWDAAVCRWIPARHSSSDRRRAIRGADGGSQT